MASHRYMNLLGLADETVRELAAEQVEPGLLRALYTYLFKLDLDHSIRRCPRLMQLHSTAEAFDLAAEILFEKLQVILMRAKAAELMEHFEVLVHA